MKVLTLKLTFVIILTSLSTANAKYKSMFAADYALSNDDSLIEVASDGSSKMTATRRWAALNGAGREELAQAKIYYEPSHTKLKFVSARTIAPAKFGFSIFSTPMVMFKDGKKIEPPKDDRAITPIDPKTVFTKEVGVAEKGVTSLRAMIIPFTNIEKNSETEYTYIETSKPLQNGIYSQTFVYGAKFPEVKGTVTIKSKLPLNYRTVGPGYLLNVTNSREGALYVLSIKIERPIYFDFGDEPSPLISKNFYPRVDVTTARSWNDIVKPLALEYEKEISKPLPPRFKRIADSAAKLKTDNERFHSVMNSVASGITYAGDWRMERGRFFPRGHAAVASSGTGDCKDYATSVVAILRSLGYVSKVALTYRAAPNDEIGKDLEQAQAVPSMSRFNHAIVHVFKDGKDFWFDPTNHVVDAQTVLSDISGSIAVILSKDTEKVLQIPDSGYENSSSELKISLRPDGIVEASGKFTISGQGANQIRQTMVSGGPKAGDAILNALLTRDFSPKGDAKLTYNRDFKSMGDFGVEYSFQTNADGIIPDVKKYAVIPLPYRFKTLGYFTADRYSSIYLGEAGVSKSRTVVEGVKGLGDVSSDCLVLSKWFAINRVVTTKDNSVVIDDEIIQKTKTISSSDFKSSDFELFLSRVGNCVNRPVVRLASDEPNSKIHVLDQLTLEKAKEIAEEDGPGAGYGDLTAVRFAERKLAQNPDDLEARLLRAKTLYFLGYSSGENFGKSYLEDSLSDINIILEKEPNKVDALSVRLSILYYLGKIDEAIVDLNLLRKLEPKHLRSIRIASKLALKKGKQEDAEKWLLFGLSESKTEKERTKHHAWLADLYEKTKQYEKAVTSYQRVLKFDPEDAWTWNNISIAYQNLEKYDDAIAAAKKALTIADFGAASSNLAASHCKKSGKALGQIESKEQLATRITEVEQPLFEGLKIRPDVSECLLAASMYYEKRVFDFKEFEHADRASEYMKRLGETGEYYEDYKWMAGNMESISKRMKNGVPLDKDLPPRPSSEFKKMREQMEARWKKIEEERARKPASVTKTISDEKAAAGTNAVNNEVKKPNAGK